MLLELLILLAVVGTLLYLFNTFFTTIDSRFKTAINAIVCLVVFVYVVTALFGHGHALRF